MLTSDITVKEINNAIGQLNKSSSPGLDGLPAEFYQELYQELSDELSPILARAFNEGIKRGYFYVSFYRGVITLLYKKGDEKNINNWRHLTLANTDYKIYAKVMMHRLNDCLDDIIEKEQTCAVKDRFMWDNLCTLREALYHKEGKGCFIVALDQKKAFHLVSREYLWETMKHFGIPPVLIDMIKYMYVQTVCQVNINGHLTEKIDIKRGVKQGCPLSAALYIIAISPLLRKIVRVSLLQDVYSHPRRRLL